MSKSSAPRWGVRGKARATAPTPTPTPSTTPSPTPTPDSWISQVSRAVDAGIFVAVAAGNAGASSWFGTFLDRDGDNVMEWDGARDECNEVRFASSTSYSVRLRWEDDLERRGRRPGHLPQARHQQGRHGLHERRASRAAHGATRPYRDHRSGDDISGELLPGHRARTANATTDWVQLVIEAEGPVAQLEHLTEGYSITSPGETTKAGVLTVGAASVLTTSTIQSTSGRGPLPASLCKHRGEARRRGGRQCPSEYLRQFQGDGHEPGDAPRRGPRRPRVAPQPGLHAGADPPTT